MLSIKVKFSSFLITSLLIIGGYNNTSSNTLMTTAQANSPTTQRTLTAPFDVDLDFIPCGAMGDAEKGTDYVKLTPGVAENPRPGDPNQSSIKFEYIKSGDRNFAGWYWLYPDQPKCNWGYQTGTKITNATKVTFWARGEKGGEVVRFFAGGVKGNRYKDSFKKTQEIRLAKTWKQYTIKIPNPKTNLAHVIGSFGWSATKSKNDKLVFYLDLIQYE